MDATYHKHHVMVLHCHTLKNLVGVIYEEFSTRNYQKLIYRLPIFFKLYVIH